MSVTAKLQRLGGRNESYPRDYGRLKPVTTVGDPPSREKNGDGSGAGPPERKQEVGD